jgi:hypothetical protein
MQRDGHAGRQTDTEAGRHRWSECTLWHRDYFEWRETGKQMQGTLCSPFLTKNNRGGGAGGCPLLSTTGHLRTGDTSSLNKPYWNNRQPPLVSPYINLPTIYGC